MFTESNLNVSCKNVKNKVFVSLKLVFLVFFPGAVFLEHNSDLRHALKFCCNFDASLDSGASLHTKLAEKLLNILIHYYEYKNLYISR